MFLRTSLLLGLCCFLIYNANGRGISAGDTYPARYLPFAIVQYHTVFLNPVANVAAQGRGDTAFWMLRVPGGRLMSLYPVTTPLLVAPLYVPAVAYLRWRGWSDAGLDYVAKLMEKLSASLIASLSVALLYLLLRRRTSHRIALALAVAFGFGTTTWMISSQALWQQGMAQLLVIVGLLLVTGPYTWQRAVLAGLVCGLIACNRPPDAILAAALGCYALFWWSGWRRGAALVTSALVPGLLLLFYNIHYAGNIGGGYGRIGKASFFNKPLLSGIAGLLVSPTHGLLVFSPFLVFLLVWRRLPACAPGGRDAGWKPALHVLMLAAVVLQILVYAKTDWRGGLSWGPRYMTDFLPFLMWMLVPVVERLGTAGRAVFATTAGVAILLEAIGAFTYRAENDLPIFVIDRGPHKMDASWQWRNAPFLTSPKHGIAPPDLAVRTRGTFDGADASAATGWALAGHRTPSHVVVMVDGLASYSTTKFTDRSDVIAALGERSPSGWRVPIETAGLSPGEHHLTALVFPFANGEAQYLGEKTLTIRSTPSAGLADDFRNAAAHLNADQRPEGFWLTAFTSGTRFVDPHPEMNTFLTALLVDLLRDSGLEENVTRARRFLTDQIEPGGLVRYHGLPDAPWIGTLGCRITPDTDDTALVWRIAPAEDVGRASARPGGLKPALRSALATIERYRTPDGLYRSWLAPRSEYECLDPGRDPNPTDIAIQMHLLLLLAKERPAGAHALCDSLRRFIDDDRVWVYYRRTPLVPMLRIGDLHDAGCDLTLPASRTRTSVAGQEIWLEVVRMITSNADRSRMQAVLHALAQDDFKAVRENPPLLFHNDLTATVPRYYWSEDVGYALWLKLYRAYERRR